MVAVVAPGEETMMEHGMTRRELLKDTAVIGVAVAAMRAADAAGAAEVVQGKMPTIKLGTLEVSRLLLGSNPFFGFAHKPGDVGRRMRQYYTSQRVMDKIFKVVPKEQY